MINFGFRLSEILPDNRECFENKVSDHAIVFINKAKTSDKFRNDIMYVAKSFYV